MCAITPRLRILVRSNWDEDFAIPDPTNELGRESPTSVALAKGLRPNDSTSILPSEVRERLIGVGHFDRSFALRHRFAFAAIGGHELVGQALEHGFAGLRTCRGD